MRNSVASRIKQLAKEDARLFVIAGDAGLGVWDDFKESGKFINPGVNEQLDIGFAAGMALMGHRVIYYNITPFVIMRPYEFVRNDICYQELPIILIATGSGITYAPAGVTHYALEDITLALSMPNLMIFSPSDPVEAIACFEYAYKSDHPSYIRIPKSGEKRLHSGSINITKPIFIHKTSSNAILLVHSSIVDEVEEILEYVDIDVATVPFLNAPMDWDLFLKEYEHIFTLEEHFVDGGFGSYLRDRCSKRVHKIGIKNEYIHKVGNRDYLRRYYGIDAKSVALKIFSKLYAKR